MLLATFLAGFLSSWLRLGLGCQSPPGLLRFVSKESLSTYNPVTVAIRIVAFLAQGILLYKIINLYLPLLLHQKFQVPEMEVLNLIRLFWGWFFPCISLTYSLGEYLHFRYLKSWVITRRVDPSHNGPL